MPPDMAVMFDVGAKPLDGQAVSADLLFVGADHITRRTMPAVGCQAVTVAVQLQLFTVKLLFIFTNVAPRAFLRHGKGTQ